MKIGHAFGEYISTGSPSSSYKNHFGTKRSKTRNFLLPVIILIFVGILLVRLFGLQVIHGGYYRSLSDNNRVNTDVLHAPRGVIFDRNNVPLVYNIPGFRQRIGDKTVLLNHETAVNLIAKGVKGIEVDSLRQYPFRQVFAHVLGYIGQISKADLKDSFFEGYHGGDLVGKMGIEKSFEHDLVGTDGKKLNEIDSKGSIVRTLGQTDPVPGKDITVTLDVGLQKTAYEAMKDVLRGAVVITTKDGEVLAMLSKPSFDPNLFTLDETYKVASDASYHSTSEMLSDTEKEPLLNRSISGTYPPGSTFKLITAAAGLENKVIDENFEVNDTGILQVGAFSFANWYFSQYGKTEGMVNVVKAIKRSNDSFFYQLAELIGVDKLSAFAQKFGLGSKLGIELLDEEKGLVPSDAWKKKVIGEGWYLGDTYHYGIGQGYLLVTPLQVNMWTSAIANGGVLYQPHLLKSSKLKVKSSKFLSDKTVSLIREGMIESCNTGGVAWPLFEFKIKNEKLKIDGRNFTEVPESTVSGSLKDWRHIAIACKTGTAQHGGLETPPHAWITMFAPAYDPQIIITVLAESSGEGSNVAAPIAKKILEEWFSR